MSISQRLVANDAGFIGMYCCRCIPSHLRRIRHEKQLPKLKKDRYRACLKAKLIFCIINMQIHSHRHLYVIYIRTHFSINIPKQYLPHLSTQLWQSMYLRLYGVEWRWHVPESAAKTPGSFVCLKNSHHPSITGVRIVGLVDFTLQGSEHISGLYHQPQWKIIKFDLHKMGNFMIPLTESLHVFSLC